eukprot:GFKZ01013180.1.p1 GENE.GFKZ01013180.1~~GFKZ01013180.1.p1  ORF type:complete len:102 (-),score=1.92 GFKZ01013180.1:252-557(-)
MSGTTYTSPPGHDLYCHRCADLLDRAQSATLIHHAELISFFAYPLHSYNPKVTPDPCATSTLPHPTTLGNTSPAPAHPSPPATPQTNQDFIRQVHSVANAA